MSGQPSHKFTAELGRFAARGTDPRITAIAERVGAPLRIAVCGRRGVGRRTVAHALGCAGLDIVDGPDADVVVYVVAEVAKPEDAAAVAALAKPVLAVLNKADLTGRAALPGVAARLGAPTAPMAGLLAVAALDNRLDERMWAALQLLAAEPIGTGCVDSFAAGPLRLPGPLRRQLVDTLDRPGIGCALAAIRRRRSAEQVRALLRRLSGIDAVHQRLDTLGATARYQRLAEAVTRLAALAVSDRRIGDWLSTDPVVAARMAAAVAVVEAAGLTVDTAADPAAQLRRAAHWQRYRRGPVTALHQGCGADIARASLRSWSRATESA